MVGQGGRVRFWPCLRETGHACCRWQRVVGPITAHTVGAWGRDVYIERAVTAAGLLIAAAAKAADDRVVALPCI